MGGEAARIIIAVSVTAVMGTATIIPAAGALRTIIEATHSIAIIITLDGVTVRTVIRLQRSRK